jgi:hypothetical protein
MLFKKERATLAEATQVAKDSLNVALVVASISIVISVIALVVALNG